LCPKEASNCSILLGLRQFNPKDFNVTNLKVNIPNLARAFSGYRIVHISDLHFEQWLFYERLAGVVEQI
jgi:predicted MPP superfamily phosphohydrolase